MWQLKELCLEVTNRCTMHCIHCSTDTQENSGQMNELNLNEICSIISDFASLGGMILEISGGEPILHPSLPEIVGFAKNKRLEVRLYTSGVGCHGTCEPLPRSLLKKLFSQGLDKVIFNLEGANSEVHDGITATPGSFRALCASINMVKRFGVWVGTHFVPMKPNAQTIGDVLKLARELSVDEVALLRFVPQGRGKSNEAMLKLRTDELWTFLKHVADLRKQFQQNPQIRIGCPLDFIAFIDSTIKLYSCKAGLLTCGISPSGDVIPCPAFKHMPEFVAGNMKNDSLRSIWKKSKVFNHLRTISYKNVRVCSKCERIDVCKGRCPAQRVRQHGDPLQGPDPDCPMPYEDETQRKNQSYFYHESAAKISELLIG